MLVAPMPNVVLLPGCASITCISDPCMVLPHNRFAPLDLHRLRFHGLGLTRLNSDRWSKHSRKMLADDPLIQCPYNPSHAILKSRMQGHIVKCKKNYPLSNKMVCPFNAIHHVDKPDYQYHVSTCPDRRIIEGYKYEVRGSEHGDLAQAPYYQPSIPVDEEDWDAETPVAAYDPVPHVETAPIVRMLCGASKAQRKAFRFRERLRMQRLIDGDAHHGPSSSSDTQSGLSVAQDDMQPLRLPREPSEALRLLDPNMGLGRGLNCHRIEEVVPGGMLSAGHCNLGFGRGTSVNTELPIPIGIGRGKPLAN